MADAFERSQMTARERRVVIAVAVVAVALGLQPLMVSRVPERQAEFAWEMFAKVGPRDEFVIESGTSTMRVSVADIVSPAKSTTDYTGVLPAHICETMDGAATVTVLRADSVLAVHECPP